MTIRRPQPRSRTPHPVDDDPFAPQPETESEIEVEDSGALRGLATAFTVIAIMGVGAGVLAVIGVARDTAPYERGDYTMPVIVFASAIAVFAVAAVLRGLADVVLQLRIQSAILERMWSSRSRK